MKSTQGMIEPLLAATLVLVLALAAGCAGTKRVDPVGHRCRELLRHRAGAAGPPLLHHRLGHRAGRDRRAA